MQEYKYDPTLCWIADTNQIRLVPLSLVDESSDPHPCCPPLPTSFSNVICYLLQTYFPTVLCHLVTSCLHHPRCADEWEQNLFSHRRFVFVPPPSFSLLPLDLSIKDFDLGANLFVLNLQKGVPCNLINSLLYRVKSYTPAGIFLSADPHVVEETRSLEHVLPRCFVQTYDSDLDKKEEIVKRWLKRKDFILCTASQRGIWPPQTNTSDALLIEHVREEFFLNVPLSIPRGGWWICSFVPSDEFRATLNRFRYLLLGPVNCRKDAISQVDWFIRTRKLQLPPPSSTNSSWRETACSLLQENKAILWDNQASKTFTFVVPPVEALPFFVLGKGGMQTMASYHMR